MSASVETLEKEVKDLRQDVVALRKALREEAARRKEGGGASGPLGAAAGKAADNVERLRSAAHDAGHRAQDQLEELERHVEANPLSSILVAFGAGFVIGKLFSR